MKSSSWRPTPGGLPISGVPVHADRLPDLGAIGGLYTALDAATADLVIVVACDLPFLDDRLLGELAERARTADGAWVRTSRGVEPLVACYQREARHRILAEIHAGRLKASDLGASLRMAEIDRSELERFGSADDLLMNINTPADYARVQYRAR